MLAHWTKLRCALNLWEMHHVGCTNISTAAGMHWQRRCTFFSRLHLHTVWSEKIEYFLCYLEQEAMKKLSKPKVLRNLPADNQARVVANPKVRSVSCIWQGDVFLMCFALTSMCAPPRSFAIVLFKRLTFAIGVLCDTIKSSARSVWGMHIPVHGNYFASLFVCVHTPCCCGTAVCASLLWATSARHSTKPSNRKSQRTFCVHFPAR